MKKQECVIWLPGVNDKKRFLLPDNMLISECIHLLVELIREDYPNVKYNENELKLFKLVTGEELERTKCLNELNISEYDEVVLG